MSDTTAAATIITDALADKDRATIEAGIATVTVIARQLPTWRNGRMWPTFRDYGKATRVYFDHEGEGVLAQFANRAARPTDIYRRVWAEHVAPALTLNPAAATGRNLRWSVKAGCSMCPCSPGFIAAPELGLPARVNGRKYDLVVTIGPECPPTTDPALAAARRDALLADPTVAGALADA